MLNSIEKFNLKEIAEQYFEESRNDHQDNEQDEEKCLGCRKMKLALEILKFVQDFDGDHQGVYSAGS